MQVRPGMTAAEYQTINRERIHALTGPIFVDGAEPGDVLQVDILEVAHRGWGWSSTIPGLGFLKDRFAAPYLFHWKLEGDVSRSLAPAVVPLRPFCGVMGVAPGEAGEFRTRPPGISMRKLVPTCSSQLVGSQPGAAQSCRTPSGCRYDG